MKIRAFPDIEVSRFGRPSLSIRVVSDRAAFDELEPAWQQLWSNADTATPFNSFAWDSTWWSVFSASMDTLQILTLWDKRELVALMPMYVRPITGHRFGALRFIGTGEAQRHEVATEYSDLLVMPGCEDMVLPVLAKWLFSFRLWSHIDLRCLLESSMVFTALTRYERQTYRLDLPTGQRYRVPLDNDTPVIDLMSADNHKRICRSLKALDRDGGLVRTQASSESCADALLDELIQLNRQRQQDKHQRSAFNSRKFLRFHKAVFPKMRAAGMADIQRYVLNDTLLACLYCFYDKHSAYYYQSGFVRENANKYMPLTAAHLQEASAAREAGLQYYDLMRAELPTYKEAMAPDTEPLFNVHLFQSAQALRRYRLLRRSRRFLVQQLGKVGIERHRSVPNDKPERKNIDKAA